MAGPGSHGGEGTHGCPLCRPGRGSGEHTGRGVGEQSARQEEWARTSGALGVGPSCSVSASLSIGVVVGCPGSLLRWRAEGAKVE